MKASLRGWQDFARECFGFGGEAMKVSSEAARGLAKTQVNSVVS